MDLQMPECQEKLENLQREKLIQTLKEDVEEWWQNLSQEA